MALPLLTWPTSETTGCEDGMTVLVHWPTPRGVYDAAAVTTITGEVIHAGNAPASVEAIYPELEYSPGSPAPQSVPLRGALVLGTSPDVWYFEESSYWAATREDLTPAGEAIVAALTQAYGTDPVFLTILST